MRSGFFSMGVPAWILFLLFAAMLQSASSPRLYFLGAVVDGTTLNGVAVDGLNFIAASAVSPDGKHVYTCGGVANIGSNGEDDNALAVFARLDNGLLAFVQAVFDNNENPPGTGDGLLACRDVAISPDGKFVYTAGRSDHSIGIYQRNAGSGALTFSAVVLDSAPSDGLRGVTDLAFSPDGTTLFAVAIHDDALTAFTRNLATGGLTFADSLRNNAGATGLDRPLHVAVSPDGKHVYTVAGHNRNSTGSDAVALFAWDAGAQQLSFVEAYVEGTDQNGTIIRGLHQASSVHVSPDGKFVYASSALWVSEPQNLNWIATFSRDSETGKLVWQAKLDHFQFCEIEILNEWEGHLEFSPDGRRLLAGSGGGAMAIFERDVTTGALTFGHGVCTFDSPELNISLPSKFAVDPTGFYLYVPGTASDALAIFDTKFRAFVPTAQK